MAVTCCAVTFPTSASSSGKRRPVRSASSASRPISQTAIAATARAGSSPASTAGAEIDANVYRIDGQTGESTIVAEGVLGPNGLCFSPDEKILYVVESRGVPNRKILAYDVSPSGNRLGNKRVLIDAGPGTPDGMRCDIDGNLWCGWGMGTPELDGVMVFAPDGAPIGRIALPERCANVCFGGVKRNRLFMAASQSIYALYVNTQGAPGG